MLPEFEAYLQANTALLPDEIKRVSSLAIPRILKRNDSVHIVGDVCKHKTFVLSGLLRNYSISADGNEHIFKIFARKYLDAGCGELRQADSLKYEHNGY